MNIQDDRTVQETRTTMAADEVLKAAKTFFARRFGGVTDKFGVQWMVIVQPATG